MHANKFQVLRYLFIAIVMVVLIFIVFYISFSMERSETEFGIIDTNGPKSAWGKSIGDVDGDGDLDILVGGHEPRIPDLITRALVKLKLIPWPSLGGELVWYENPSWRKHVISEDFRIRTDLELGDINNDGSNDVVALTDQGIVAFYGPDWHSEIIDSAIMHDIELADMDLDGDLDMVFRDQTLFGHNRGEEVVIFWQGESGQWSKQKMTIQSGEGLKVADINSDSFPDIVVNKYILFNPNGQHDQVWAKLDYVGQWIWDDVFIDVSDINEDGAPDILMSPAEPEGSFYRVSWFQNPGNNQGVWLEHIIEDQVETVQHFIGAGDYNGDGYVDIFSAEMNQGVGENPVSVYLNDGAHMHWQKTILGLEGSHSMQVADFDGDFDVELVGANWQIKDYEGAYAVSMWNFLPEDQEPLWRRHKIGDSKVWKSLFVCSGLIDGDALPDIAAGRYWYQNPGRIDGVWEQHLFGGALNNQVLLSDFDNDTYLDVLASKWRGRFEQPGLVERIKNKVMGLGYPGNLPGNEFSWGRNDGKGNFEVFENIAIAKGDYLQGIAQVNVAGKDTIVLSWHKEGYGIQMLQVPANAANEIWPWEKISKISQDEQVSVADINKDGLDDLVLGTIWLNQAEGWAAKNIASNMSKPDRNRIADFNQDGWADILVGEEAVDKLGRVLWYENPRNQEKEWPVHNVGVFFGPMSLDVADIDDDKDLDVVVGEHRLQHPDMARLIQIENRDGKGLRWLPSVIYTGDEHHDGAHVVDLDKDGDKDIVSIGWGHSKVMVYENLKNTQPSF